MQPDEISRAIEHLASQLERVDERTQARHDRLEERTQQRHEHLEQIITTRVARLEVDLARDREEAAASRSVIASEVAANREAIKPLETSRQRLIGMAIGIGAGSGTLAGALVAAFIEVGGVSVGS